MSLKSPSLQAIWFCVATSTVTGCGFGGELDAYAQGSGGAPAGGTAGGAAIDASRLDALVEGERHGELDARRSSSALRPSDAGVAADGAGADQHADGACASGSKQSCYTGPPGTLGVGPCKAGSQTCTAGVWGTCAGEVEPAAKDLCDGGDQNCDGKPNGGCACTNGAQQACGSDVGECKKGKQTCAGGAWGACAGQVAASEELCDCKDNDCDGHTDEGTACAAVTVDLDDYIRAPTPGFKMCEVKQGSGDPVGCIDGWGDAFGEWEISYWWASGAPGVRDYLLRDKDSPLLFGVHKTFNGQSWHCFANPGQTCGQPRADYPIQGMPMKMTLPVIPLCKMTYKTVTPGASLLPEFAAWREVDIRPFDPNNCSQGAPVGKLWHRNWVFVAGAVSLGGSLGVRKHVLVLEQDSASFNPPGFGGGERLERYWYVSGYGRIREGGWESPTCSACTAWIRSSDKYWVCGVEKPGSGSVCSGHTHASACSGDYVQNCNDAAFNTKVAGDYHVGPICPYP